MSQLSVNVKSYPVTALKGDKMTEVRKPSYRLTFYDAVEIWIRVWNGEFQNRIAADYDVNPGRISDVVKQRVHYGSRAVAMLRYKISA